jgi:hypothetical protein
MTIAQKIGQLTHGAEVQQGAKDFCHIAKFLMLGKDSVFAAIELAKEKRATTAHR